MCQASATASSPRTTGTHAWSCCSDTHARWGQVVARVLHSTAWLLPGKHCTLNSTCRTGRLVVCHVARLRQLSAPPVCFSAVLPWPQVPGLCHHGRGVHTGQGSKPGAERGRLHRRYAWLSSQFSYMSPRSQQCSTVAEQHNRARSVFYRGSWGCWAAHSAHHLVCTVQPPS